MQSLIDSLLQVIDSHVSIRRYKPHEMDDDTLEKLIYAGIRAPSSANLQPYTIIAVREQGKKDIIAELCGNQLHIRQCSVFLLFTADYYRASRAMEKLGIEPAEPNIYALYVAAVDAALAAQNIALAAEAMGYGICYIGAVQNNPCRIAELLGLPEKTYPLFGMTIGIPDEEPPRRIRLPVETILHREGYEDAKEGDVIETYREAGHLDSLVRRFNRYLSREGGVARRFPSFIECLERRGFRTTP